VVLEAFSSLDLQGTFHAGPSRFAVVVSRFNAEVTEGLLAGALAALDAAGVGVEARTIVRVPGAFELPVTAQRLAESGRFDAVVCLGCLIKGDTMHFEYIAEAVSQGLSRVALDAGVPVAFGVLTTLTDEQALERARPGEGNKGAEVARAAVEMASLFRTLDAGAPS
jgi:6,7-dimethyl-8-ribityllumazine synthase